MLRRFGSPGPTDGRGAVTVAASDQLDLDLAHEFARAYRDLDEVALRGLVAPDLRSRVLSPPGYHEIEGVDGLLAELRGLVSQWEVLGVTALHVQLLGVNRMNTGRQARIVQTFTLREVGGSQTAVMQVTNLIAIVDGRIALFHEFSVLASCLIREVEAARSGLGIFQNESCG